MNLDFEQIRGWLLAPESKEEREKDSGNTQERCWLLPTSESDFPLIARTQLETQRAWNRVFIWAPGWPEGQLGSYQDLEALTSEGLSKTRWLLIPVMILNHEIGNLKDYFFQDLQFPYLLYRLNYNYFPP